MKRVKTKKIIITLIFYMLIIITSSKSYAEEKIDVLFISSYNPSHIVFEDQVRGIKEGLGNNVNLMMEYMSSHEGPDGKEEFNDKDEENFSKLLKYNKSIYGDSDIVLVGDDEALKFSIKYREELFKNIPIVFFAVENQELIDKALKHDLVSGVKEEESVDATIQLIRKLHKEVKNIIFLEKNLEGYIFNKFYKEAEEKYKDINFEKIITTQLSKDEFKKKLSTLNDEHAIITFYPNIFENNEWISNMNVIKMISENAKNTPIYQVLSYGVGHGSIGGKVVSHFQQGKSAGEIAQGIINGENPKHLYIANDKANKYMFDYNVLKFFGIKVKDLPKESTILNHPKDTIIIFKNLEINVIFLLILLTIIIFVLIGYLIHRKRYIKGILQAKKAAEEMNNLKAHFISNISHELKTPITVIMSVIQLEKSKHQNINYEKNDTSLEIVNNNCNRLIRLLDNIIDFEKYEQGEIDLDLETCNIIELLEDVVLSVEPYTRAKNLELVFDTDSEEVIMQVDRKKIERVILNLLSNAIKYSKEKGNIMVTVCTNKQQIIINVEDDGIGIEEKYIDKIFDRFVQIDDSHTRKNEGSGIGLSIIKAFVHLHKGKITVKSKVNQGSKFTIKLPLQEIYNKNIVKRQSNEDTITRIELSDIYF